mgnify:CR=1
MEDNNYIPRQCIGDYTGFNSEQINGECTTCGMATVNGEAYASCEWGDDACIECGCKQCNDGC